jgi:branched-chain amino acid transport system ATP-binding protein
VRQDRGTAFVLVEHNVEFVLDLSDRVTVLDFGEVLTEGTPEEIRASAEVQAAYFGAPVDNGNGDTGPGSEGTAS